MPCAWTCKPRYLPGQDLKTACAVLLPRPVERVLPGMACMYYAGQNDYLPFFFFDGLITEFGNKLPDRFFSPGGAIFESGKKCLKPVLFLGCRF